MCSSESNILIREDVANISTLTLNKPEKHNVLSWQMLDALQSELDSIAADEVLWMFHYFHHYFVFGHPIRIALSQSGY